MVYSPTVVNHKYAVFINEVQVQVTSLTMNEAMGNLCRVIEFELAEQPATEPDMDDVVLVQLLDYDNEVTYDLFGGTSSAFEVDSYPWSYIIQATDQLEKLRRAPAHDHVYTGMTVTEALFDILDSCDIDYDPDDIVDIDYVLGDKVKISWPAGVAGADMVTSFNEVFGTVLETIGNNRVIWILPEMPPTDEVGKYRDFHKGYDADWDSHHRSRGNRDAIQNLWEVRGASWPCGPGDPPECTCQPWAKSVSGNSQLGGRRIRTATQSIVSDLIQDEALAEYVVRRQMRLTNRIPDTALVDTVDDTNVHPGTKLGLIDHTYGINTEALRICTVTSVDRNGHTMSLNMICGTPGNEGVVTHGVEKVCNETHSDIDVPGDFEPPDFEVPDFEGGIDFPEFPPFSFPEFELPVFPPLDGPDPDPDPDEGDTCFDLSALGWTELSGTWTIAPTYVQASGSGFFEIQSDAIPDFPGGDFGPLPFNLEGTVQLAHAANEASISFENTTGDVLAAISYTTANECVGDPGIVFETDADVENDAGDLGTGVLNWTIGYDGFSQYFLTLGGENATLSRTSQDDTGEEYLVRFTSNWCSDSDAVAQGARLSNVQLCYPTAILESQWTEIEGPTESDGDDLTLTAGQAGSLPTPGSFHGWLVNTGREIPAGSTVEMSFTLQFEYSSNSITFGFVDEPGYQDCWTTVYGTGDQFFGATDDTLAELHNYTDDDVYDTVALGGGWTTDPIAVTMSYNMDTDVANLVMNDGTRSLNLTTPSGTPSGSSLFPFFYAYYKTPGGGPGTSDITITDFEITITP